MTGPEQWRELEALVQAALDLEPEQRERFLAHAAGEGKTELHREARALIAAHEQAGEFLDNPACERLRPAGAPAVIDSYRVVRRLGGGGMGEVYLASRNDEEFHQLVAIKVLAPGLCDEELIGRFRSERQILANLDHPNIAKLLGGGTLPDGRPYLVMEYVDGVPLHHFCERGVSLDRCLALFLDICQAVSHAHRGLVLHLDLKPHNVLVTTAGVPKLLDFGIAKLLRAGAETAGPRPMTPDYASPEQHRGGVLTTASDVYSLGVILHRVLTGVLPRAAGDEASTSAVWDGGDLVRPSAVPSASTAGADGRVELAASDVRVRAQLRGDLDAIILKALRADPARRYLSVDQLREDIERHRAALPVHARRDTLRYRLGKLVRRHRGAVVAGSLGVAVASALTTAMWIQAERLEEQLQRTDDERAKVRRISSLMVELAARLSEYDRASSLRCQMQSMHETISLPEQIEASASLGPARFHVEPNGVAAPTERERR
ncbi:MAG: serine/threonine-protein kinase [Myxococcota bacterium]